MTILPIVIVTREEDEKTGRLGEALRKAGLEPRHVPLVKSQPLAEDDLNLAPAIETMPNAGWVLFTSRRAVEFWFDALKRKGSSLDCPSGPRIGAVGKGTAEELTFRGWNASLIPQSSGGEGLADALIEKENLSGQTIIFPRAATVASDWSERLTAAGAHVISPVLYETISLKVDLEDLVDEVAAGQIDALTFTSPSAVESFEYNLQRCGREWGSWCILAAIGLTTGLAIETRGFEPLWLSPRPEFSKFAEALAGRILSEE